MAIITVSNTGGNFFTAACWVGGIIPTSVDSIAFTATSGPLFVDDAFPIFGVNFTNYTNTITFVVGTNGSFVFDETSGNPFINMGTGGYTIVDNSTDGGFDFSTVSINTVVLTNPLGIANPARFTWFPATNPIQITGTWLQTGPMGAYDIQISSGTFTYIGSVFDGFNYFFSGTAALGSTINLTTTDALIEFYAYGTGTFNINCVNITGAYIESATLFNLNCVDIVDIQVTGLTHNITCVNITNSITMAGTVNLLGTGTLPVPQLLMTVQGTGLGTRNDYLNSGTYTFTNVYYNSYSNVGGDNVNINLVSVLNCDKLYIRKPVTMTSKFLGAFGFVCNEFIIDGTVTNGQVGPITFESGTSYYINNVVDIRFPTTMLSSNPGVKANLILGQNVNQNTISFLTATDIDCSLGKRVNNFYGTVTNCDNIRVWNDNTLPQVPSTF